MKMDDNYIAVNKTKQEYFTAWDIGKEPKLWEWCVKRGAGLFPYLLTSRDESGVDDVDHKVPNPQYAGRWAGDEIYLVGKANISELYQKAMRKYANIAKELVEEY